MEICGYYTIFFKGLMLITVELNENPLLLPNLALSIRDSLDEGLKFSPAVVLRVPLSAFFFLLACNSLSL